MARLDGYCPVLGVSPSCHTPPCLAPRRAERRGAGEEAPARSAASPRSSQPMSRSGCSTTACKRFLLAASACSITAERWLTASGRPVLKQASLDGGASTVRVTDVPGNMGHGSGIAWTGRCLAVVERFFLRCGARRNAVGGARGALGVLCGALRPPSLFSAARFRSSVTRPRGGRIFRCGKEQVTPPTHRLYHRNWPVEVSSMY